MGHYNRIIPYISMFCILIGCIVYTNHVGNAAVRASERALHQSQQQLCSVLLPVNDLYQKSTTELGKQLAAQFQELVNTYHCEVK